MSAGYKHREISERTRSSRRSQDRRVSRETFLLVTALRFAGNAARGGGKPRSCYLVDVNTRSETKVGKQKDRIEQFKLKSTLPKKPKCVCVCYACSRRTQSSSRLDQGGTCSKREREGENQAEHATNESEDLLETKRPTACGRISLAVYVMITS